MEDLITVVCVLWLQGSSTLADLGTEQVEFIGLSQRTGNPKYKQKVLYLSSLDLAILSKFSLKLCRSFSTALDRQLMWRMIKKVLP